MPQPDGLVLSRPRREEIARLAETGDTVIVDDMTLADLAFHEREQAPLAALTKSAAVVTIDSLSKVFWPGLRVGWMRAPGPLVERLARLKLVADLGSSHASQLVALRLLPFIEEIGALRRQQLQERLDVLTSELRTHLPEWSWSRPAGGACLWVRLPLGDGEAFAQVAYRHGVRVLPGSRMSTSDGADRHLRITYVLEPAELIEAVQRLRRAWLAFGATAATERAPIEVAV